MSQTDNRQLALILLLMTFFTVSKLLPVLLLLKMNSFFASGHWTCGARQELEGHWHLPAGDSGGALPHRSVHCTAVKGQVLLQTRQNSKRWSVLLHQVVSWFDGPTGPLLLCCSRGQRKLLMPISCLVWSNHRAPPFPVRDCGDFFFTISAQFATVQATKTADSAVFRETKTSVWRGHSSLCFVFPVDDDGKRSGSPLTLDDLFDRNFQVHDPGAKWINGKQKNIHTTNADVQYWWNDLSCQTRACGGSSTTIDDRCVPDDDFAHFCLRWRADISQLWRRRFENQHTQKRDRDPDEKLNVCTFF